MSEFTGLTLDVAKIADTIKTYPGVVRVEGPTQKGKASEYAIHSAPGTPVALLHVYHRDDGRTTLQPKVGQNQELSSAIARHLVQTVSMERREPRPLSLKFISEDNWQFLLDSLRELGLSVEPQQHADAERYRVSAGRKDDVLIHRYKTTGSFLMQGKALGAYSHVVSVLAYIDGEHKALVDAQLSTVRIEGITSELLLKELEQRMPDAFSRISETTRCIFAPALGAAKIHVDLTDYSLFTHPVLRGLEACIKELFSSKGVSVDRRAGVGAHFDQVGAMLPESKALVSCIATCTAIEQIYAPYATHRNSLFHADSNPVTTRIIDNRGEAVEIIDSALFTVQRAYAQLPT